MTDVVVPGTDPEHKNHRRKSRRRISFWIGLGLLLAGLGILAWLAWQIWGTNWVSRREERREVKLFESNSAAGPPALLKVPKFGADYVVPINEGTSQSVLAKGVAHFPGTAGPGQIGNYALAGHRITHGQPFADLPSLRPGDEVDVVTRTETYVYVLDTDPNKLIVPFTAGWVLASDPKNPGGGTQALQGPDERLITLVTCSELFHTDNRMVVFGHLVRVEPTTTPAAQ